MLALRDRDHCLSCACETCAACLIHREGHQIRILIADDSEAFRRAVKKLLSENSPEWVVCGEATNGEDAVRDVAKLLPEVILLDLSIPLLNGLRVAEILKRDYPDLAVIVMSEQDPSVLSRLADVAGIQHSVPKSRAALDLVPILLSLRQDSRKNYNDRTGLNLAVGPKTPGFFAIGIFLFFGAIMASLAATTLLWRGTALDHLWALNPIAYKQLAPLGGTFGILFLLLGAALTTAGVGWFRRRLWGWRLAVVIIAIQVLGDVVNCARGELLRGGTGVIIAGALLLFLLQRRIRAAFS